MEEVKDPKVVAQLNPEQFFKWRLSTEKLLHARTKKLLNEREVNILDQSAKIAALRAQLKRMSLRDTVIEAEDEAKKVKEDIEKELNVSLSECVINEFTMEAQKLPERE